MNKSMLYELSEEVLSSKNNVKFRIYGQSMKPLIESGYIVEVSHLDKLSDICSGDIVLFKNEADRPCLHRIIRIIDNKIYAKGDANNVIDKPLQYNEIIGKLISIEKSDHLIHIKSKKLNRLYSFSWILYQIIDFIQVIAKPFLKFIQSLLLNRGFNRKWLRGLLEDKIKVSIANTDDVYDICRLYKCTNPDKIKEVHDQIINKNTYIIAKLRKKTIGVSQLIFNDDRNEILVGGWWLSGLKVKARFRGIGAGQAIIKQAIIMVREFGGTSINLLAFKDRKPARRLYEKLGFNKIINRDVENELDEEVKQGISRRILMVKRLDE